MNNRKKVNNKIKQKIIGLINNKLIKNIAITFHYAPDGDAIGSAVALALALESSLNKSVDIITRSYSSIFTPIIQNVSIVKKI